MRFFAGAATQPNRHQLALNFKKNMHIPFHGSYRAEQVEFLLKPISLTPVTDTAHKEALIQSGQKHYSEMLSPEYPPSPAYLQLFEAACAANRARMAQDCLQLAALIAARHAEAPVLVSLARAGTPVGVIVRQILSRHYQCAVPHYSISIIRDRGIDSVALQYILAQGHAPERLVFIDGWTGKGVISRELQRFVQQFNQTHATAVSPDLYVLSDLAGTAACAASADDYLIPSAILNATVSGLISRSVLNDSIGADDFHGCVFYRELAPHDVSQRFADDIAALAAAAPGLPIPCAADTRLAAQTSADYMAHARARYGIRDDNLIKPGIGEATRVLLRSQPERLIVRALNEPQTAHLVRLAQEKHVPVSVDAGLPYHAVSLIRTRHPRE